MDRTDPEYAYPNDPEYAKALLERLVRGTRLSNAMPTDIQHDYAATFPGYQAAMAGMGTRLTGMMQGFVEQQGVTGGCNTAVPAGSMDDVSTRFDTVVELSDRLLDRVDADLDRHRGGAGPAGSAAALGAPLQASHRPQAGAALSAGSATRPQLRWREEVEAPLLHDSACLHDTPLGPTSVVEQHPEVALVLCSGGQLVPAIYPKAPLQAKRHRPAGTAAGAA